MRRAALLLALLACALSVGACGADKASNPANQEPDEATSGTLPAEPAPAAEPATVDDEAVGVVRAWSAALNAGDNDEAAALFAPDAVVIQGGNVLPLPTREAARTFNASLPCSGELVDVTVDSDVITAVFALGDRQASLCDAAPGTLAAAEFVVEDGLIVSWRLAPVPAEDPASPRGAV